jgi:hypothetical protein
LIEAVRRAVLTRDADQLQQSVRKIKFKDSDAFLISVAVAVTRNMTLPKKSDPVECGNPFPTRWELIDALCVMFMFNVVNRIANAYGLLPEWNSLRRTETVRHATGKLMSVGVSYQMPLVNDDDEESGASLVPFIESLLHEFHIVAVSPVWQQLQFLPSVERAIYQLLSVALSDSNTDSAYFHQVTQDCIGLSEGTSGLPAPDSHLAIWRLLFAEPHKISHTDLSNLELSAEAKLDLVFRVSMLAGINKLNCNSVRNLIVQAFNV